MAWLAHGIRLPLAALAAALALYPLLLGNAYSEHVLTVAGVYALLVIGYQFIFGHAGALSLAQGCFFGIGAYVSAILATRFGWSFALSFPLALAAPAALAALVALPVLRLESHYLALATLGIAQVTLLAATNWQALTGGANGISGVPPIALFGLGERGGAPLMLLIWLAAAAGGLLAWQIARGLYGRMLHLTRENAAAAAALGIDASALRFASFLLSALYAGAAGALYAHAIGVISPGVLAFPVMVACLAMAVIGGATRVSGAILGAVLLVGLPESLRVFEKFYLIAYGAALLVVTTVAPAGLIGALEELRQRLFPEPAPLPPAPRLAPLRAAARSEARPLLEATGLGIAFGGVRALEDLSFEVRPGELLGLIGPNGSGKTTLVNLLSGFERRHAGRIRFAGEDITELASFRRARRGLARTFQSVSVVAAMTALDNVALGRVSLAGTGLASALSSGREDAHLVRAREHAMALLDSLGVAALAARPCGELSHGTARRVEIARALALEPRLLILDEPAAGLTEEESADLARRLRALAAGGLSLLVIEHNMPWLMPLAERVICLDEGRIIAEGTSAQVRASARVIEAYLGRQAAAEVPV